MYSLSGVCTRWLKEGPLEAEFSDALAFFTSDAFCVCLRHYLISPFLLLHRGFICSIRHWDFLRLGDSLFWQLWRKKDERVWTTWNFPLTPAAAELCVRPWKGPVWDHCTRPWIVVQGGNKSWHWKESVPLRLVLSQQGLGSCAALNCEGRWLLYIVVRSQAGKMSDCEGQ